MRKIIFILMGDVIAIFQASKLRVKMVSTWEILEVIMKQLHVDRNTAVKALKNTGDVVDAIFEISNR